MRQAEHPNIIPQCPVLPGDRRTILLLGNYRPAVVIARALAARGYRIVLGLEGEPHGCEYSRFVHETWDHPHLETDRHRFLPALKRFVAERPDIGAVLPVTEEFVNLFAHHSEPFADDVVLVSPSPEVVNVFASKPATLDLAERRAVPTNPFKQVHSHRALIDEANRIGFPITVRPLGTTARLFDKKALILDTSENLKLALPDWPKGHDTLLLQRFANGIRHNLYFAALDGQIIATCESRILRTDRPDGTGLAVDGETVPVSPVLFRDTQALIEDTGYTGIGLAQFIVDAATGERCFLELNPRVSGSHAVPENAGIPLSALAVDLALISNVSHENKIKSKILKMLIDSESQSNELSHYNKTYKLVRYVWTSGDLASAKLALTEGEIGYSGLFTRVCDTVRSAVRADTHMIWTLSDPLPAMMALTVLLPRFTRARNAVRRLVNQDRYLPRAN